VLHTGSWCLGLAMTVLRILMSSSVKRPWYESDSPRRGRRERANDQELVVSSVRVRFYKTFVILQPENCRLRGRPCPN
jgi:hypothetical protein